MINIQNKEKCYGCSACFNTCPKNAITMVQDNEGFKYPIIDKNKCIDCNICDNVCPEFNQIFINGYLEKNKFYAAVNNNEKNRMKETSGGVFSLLSEKILNQNGIIYGVIYDEKNMVVHERADNIHDVEKMYGSKYVQSDKKDIFKKVKQDLDKNIKVLFTGTPCEVYGLKLYLKKYYDNLYTCDIVCHGTPSPKIYDNYRKHLECENNSKIKSINFRDKVTGWNKYCQSIVFENGKSLQITAYNSEYMRGFISNVYLRPSCHSCRFAKVPKYADITLGDFWGINKHYPQINDEKGTSLVVINTEKGLDMFNECISQMKIIECTFEQAVEENPSLIHKSKPHIYRKKYFNDVDKYDFSHLAKKYYMSNE